jgi:hypothetical protein
VNASKFARHIIKWKRKGHVDRAISRAPYAKQFEVAAAGLLNLAVTVSQEPIGPVEMKSDSASPYSRGEMSRSCSFRTAADSTNGLILAILATRSGDELTEQLFTSAPTLKKTREPASLQWSN